MLEPPRVLVVGATGYLGSHIIKQLQREEYDFKALARNRQKLLDLGLHDHQVVEAQATDPDSLVDLCKNIDVVISCLGITRQRDGLKYMDVDYQANFNILVEAEKSGVEKFIYISATHGHYRSLNKLFIK